MPPKVDVQKLMADLAAQKSKLLEQKKKVDEQSGSKATPTASSKPVVVPRPVVNAPTPAQQAAALLSAKLAASSNTTANPVLDAKAAKIAEVKARVAAQLAKNPKLAGIVGAIPSQQQQPQQQPKNTPRALMLDDQGREVDEFGNVVDIKRVSSSLANQKVAEAERRKAAQEKARLLLETDAKEETKGKHFDPRMRAGKVGRGHRSFNFVQPGTYVKRAEQFRDNQLKQELKDEANQRAGVTVMDSDDIVDEAVNPNLIVLGAAAARTQTATRTVPDVEWWDMPFLVEERSYLANIEEDGDGMAVDDNNTASTSQRHVNVVESRITHYVEHPVRVKPLLAAKPPPPMKVMLTRKEIKRMRKRNRAEREQERQERVLLGLEEASKGRVKISNFMKVRGAEAVQDPTQAEAQVRREIAAREAAHQARNDARKLTPEERKEKKRRKLVEDTANGVTVAVFRVNDLSHPQRRFKVDATARDAHMTGVALLAPNFAVVVVEGGPKAVLRFKKLMLRRIDWKANVAIRSQKFLEAKAAEEGDEIDEDTVLEPVEVDYSDNECVMVWEGVLAKRNFKAFAIETAANEKAARFFLRQHQAEHYFDICTAAETNDGLGKKNVF